MAQVAEPQRAAFVEVMQELQIVRLRDGASRRDLFRDTAAPERFLETFVVGSWAEHLRQHERVTNADRSVEERALVLLQPGTVPLVAHLIATGGSNKSSAEPSRAAEIMTTAR